MDQEPEITAAEIEELIGGPLDFESPVSRSIRPLQTQPFNSMTHLQSIWMRRTLPAWRPSRCDSMSTAMETLMMQGKPCLLKRGPAAATRQLSKDCRVPRVHDKCAIVAIDTLGNFRIDDRNISVIAAQDPQGPEVRVSGNGIAIVSGSVTATFADQTDFGSLDRDRPRPIRTFSVYNGGAAGADVGRGETCRPASQ